MANAVDGRPRIVASNAPIFVASIIPGDLPKGREDEVYDRLASVLGTPAETIRQKVDKQKSDSDMFTPVPIKYNLDRMTALMLYGGRLELPGVAVTEDDRGSRWPAPSRGRTGQGPGPRARRPPGRGRGSGASSQAS